MGFLTALLPILGKIGTTIAASLFPDPADELKRQKLQQALQRAVIDNAAAIEQAAASIVRAEISSGTWLAKSWRPIVMLGFFALIVLRWLGYAAPGMSEAEYLSVYELIKLGLGGYVVGRSVEKIAPGVIAAITERGGK